MTTESTTEPTIGPCPVCGGVGEPVLLWDKSYIACTATKHSPYPVPLADWNRLSLASQLLAAVEALAKPTLMGNVYVTFHASAAGLWRGDEQEIAAAAGPSAPEALVALAAHPDVWPEVVAPVVETH